MSRQGGWLRDRLGTLDKVTVRGVVYSVADEAAIDHGVDWTDLLDDGVERYAFWQRVLASTQVAERRAYQELQDKINHFHHSYYEALEAQERREMREHHHDETETAKDAADAAAGDQSFKIRRRQREAARVTHGLSAGRWRRNFSDDLVNSMTHVEPGVVVARTKHRLARAELDKVEAMNRIIENRNRVIQQQVALHRDTLRQ